MQPDEFPSVILELLAVHDGLSRMGFRNPDNMFVDVDEPKPRVILEEKGKKFVITVDKLLGMDQGMFKAQWYSATAAYNDVWRDEQRDRVWQQSMFRRRLDSVVGALRKAGITIPLEEELRRKERIC